MSDSKPYRILEHRMFSWFKTIYRHNCRQILLFIFNMWVRPLIKVRNGLKSPSVSNWWHGEEKKTHLI